MHRELDTRTVQKNISENLPAIDRGWTVLEGRTIGKRPYLEIR